MLEASFPAFLFCPPGVTWKPMCELLGKLESIKAESLLITDRSNKEAAGKLSAKASLTIPADLTKKKSKLPEDLFTPIPYVIPAQLLAANLAEVKGLDPDKPRTLNKVTLTL
jgi:glucosamine--fructose-6-phosphate aminotransferase (isomerizing)